MSIYHNHIYHNHRNHNLCTQKILIQTFTSWKNNKYNNQIINTI